MFPNLRTLWGGEEDAAENKPREKAQIVGKNNSVLLSPVPQTYPFKSWYEIQNSAQGIPPV